MRDKRKKEKGRNTPVKFLVSLGDSVALQKSASAEQNNISICLVF